MGRSDDHPLYSGVGVGLFISKEDKNTPENPELERIRQSRWPGVCGIEAWSVIQVIEEQIMRIDWLIHALLLGGQIDPPTAIAPWVTDLFICATNDCRRYHFTAAFQPQTLWSFLNWQSHAACPRCPKDTNLSLSSFT